MITFHVSLQGCKTKTGKDFINNDIMMMKLQIKKGPVADYDYRDYSSSNHDNHDLHGRT